MIHGKSLYIPSYYVIFSSYPSRDVCVSVGVCVEGVGYESVFIDPLFPDGGLGPSTRIFLKAGSTLTLQGGAGSIPAVSWKPATFDRHSKLKPPHKSGLCIIPYRRFFLSRFDPPAGTSVRPVRMGRLLRGPHRLRERVDGIWWTPHTKEPAVEFLL